MVVAVVDMVSYSKSPHFFVLFGIGRQQQLHLLASTGPLVDSGLRNSLTSGRLILSLLATDASITFSSTLWSFCVLVVD